MTGRQLLSVDEVDTGYGGTQVLHGLSLALDEGEALAVLGANGAGKSTLMMTIAGLVRPWRGAISYAGDEITKVPAEERIGRGIALVPEGRQIFASLSIEENLRIGGACLKRKVGPTEARRLIDEGVERAFGMFPVLGKRPHDSGAALSGGQQQMLAISRALMSRPNLLLMDEPCMGLSPKLGNEVYETLSQLRSEGQSMVIVEESSRRALEFVDRACILKVGRKVLDGDAKDLLNDDALLSAYFGIDQAVESQ
jgi:branched-chain amino acid transport system ATP-binding protein